MRIFPHIAQSGFYKNLCVYDTSIYLFPKMPQKALYSLNICPIEFPLNWLVHLVYCIVFQVPVLYV